MPPTTDHQPVMFARQPSGLIREINPGQPLRMLLLGDFGARWHRVVNEPFAGRPIYEVGPANLENVLGSYGTNLTLPMPGELNDQARIMIRSLHDFHPDVLLGKIPSLAELLATRTLATAPAVERQLSGRLRSLLHDPDFQATESAWRGLDFLVRHCPDRERVQYWVLDASMEEITADLEGLQKLLRHQVWHAVIGQFTFGETAADLATLAGLGSLARSLDSVLYAGAHPQLIGCESFATQGEPELWKAELPDDVRTAWQDLQASDAAAHIGLALPRFVLRQPYGHEVSPIASFDFEERTDQSSHEDFLWGNSALLCAQLLAARQVTGEPARSTAGMFPGCLLEIETARLTPCTETRLGERATEYILRKGLIPVRSTEGGDTVLIPELNALRAPDETVRTTG
jgi:predicted component of type VI protein secretion system